MYPSEKQEDWRPLVFYILVISRCFSRLGTARKRAKDKKQEWFIWFLGSALFANVVAFFGVNYFDQSRIAWFALVSMICACTAPLLKPELGLKTAGTPLSCNWIVNLLSRMSCRTRKRTWRAVAPNIFPIEFSVNAMNTRYVVVTPVRDEESYLPLTIESMVRQTIRPQEWIIVNDGSRDKTAEIIEAGIPPTFVDPGSTPQ